MARPSRSRSTRIIITAAVLIVTLGAALQFRRVNRSTAASTPPPIAPVAVALPVVVPAAKAPVAHTTPAVKPVVTAVQPIQPLITRTPDLTKPPSTPPTLWATSATTATAAPTAPVAPVTDKAPTAPPADIANDVLSQAKALFVAGDLLAARKMLNEALLAGNLSETDTTAVKKWMAEINQTVVFSARPFPKDPLGGVYEVKAGDRLAAIGAAHGIPFELLMSLNHMTDARRLRYGQMLKVINGPFHVVVTKSKFTLDVYLGSPAGKDSTYITSFPVGLGTANSTPTGTWIIKNKVTHPAYFSPEGRSGGVMAPDDPKNPLGPYWLGLEGTDGQAVGQRSYGIHGTIDPDSIGKMSSMGCIRLHNQDVEVVYKLLIPGKSTVVVKD